MVEELSEKQQNFESVAKPEARSRSGLWIGIIVLLVVVLVAGAGFYLLQQLRSQSDNINKEDQRNIENAKQISGFQSQLAAMQSQLSHATASIANTEERFEGRLTESTKVNQDKLATTRKELTDAISQVQRQLGKTRGDWMMADAEYLLTVAGQRLHLIGDIETTREALEAADQRLRESGDAGAFKVREQIAKELASLRAIPVIDFVGLYSTLDSLGSRVEQLTLFLPYQGKLIAKSSEHDKHNAPSPTSSDLVNFALKQVDGYVTVRYTEQPIKAILTTEQAQFLRQELSLKLEMAKLALVQKNQTLYQASLKDALAWLDKHFNKNAQTTDFIAQITKLNEVKLNAQMPDISLSLKMLRDITKLRIESDKVSPPRVEPKIDSNNDAKPSDAKPVSTEKPAENAVSKPEAAAAETKTDKPVAAKPTSSDDKKPEATVTEESKAADKKVASDTDKTPEDKKSAKSNTSDSSDASEDKKPAESKPKSDKAASKPPHKPSADKDKTSDKPKPVVVH